MHDTRRIAFFLLFFFFVFFFCVCVFASSL